MSYQIHCDRCRGAQYVSGTGEYPATWRKVEDKDLCSKCSKQLDEFLQRLPEAARGTL